MEVVEPFSFWQILGADLRNKLKTKRETLEWAVPSGAKVDGASIPRGLWTIFGAPFTGKYRKASVVHDHFCDSKTRPWEATHRAFYDAMLASGEDIVRAKLMYYAVYRFGPRWETTVRSKGSDGTWKFTRKVFETVFDQGDLDDILERLSQGDVSIEQLEKEALERRMTNERLSCTEDVTVNVWQSGLASVKCRLRP
jgi:hypothetical protein